MSTTISISLVPGPVVVLADHFQVALLFEILLMLLLRRVAEQSPFVVSVVAGHDAAVVSFRAFVRIGAKTYGEGEGRSKKEAEQQAAEAAWNAISESLAPRHSPEAPD